MTSRFSPLWLTGCWLAIVLGAVACKKPPDKIIDQKVATEGTGPLPTKADAPDPRLTELFSTGTSCMWNDEGLANCEAAKKMEKLVFENQDDSALASGCMRALGDSVISTRGLAAVCLRGFTDRVRTPLLGAGIDRFEAEPEPKIKHAISWAFSNGNANAAGVEPRVVELVRSLSDGQDDVAAAHFLESIFPSYLAQGSAAPSKAAGDLALELAGQSGPRTQARAIEHLERLNDRKTQVCTALGDALRTEHWSAAIRTMTKFPAECATQFDAAIETLAAQMKAGKYDPSMRSVGKSVPLTKAQVAKLAPASKVLVTKVPDWQQKDAKELAQMFDPYKAPSPK